MKVTTLCILICSIAFQETSTDKLLRNPFDLQQFKKAKGPSNSGVADIQKYYFQPEEKGVYFRFFIFRSPHTFVYSKDVSKKEHVQSGTGFQIVTYKPSGKYRDAYLDPTETLIELTASYNDPDLPELAFVGLDTIQVKKKLGNDFIRKGNSFIYTSENRVLVLNVNAGVVKCLKYAKLNTKITRDSNLEELIEMNCTNQPVR